MTRPLITGVLAFIAIGIICVLFSGPFGATSSSGHPVALTDAQFLLRTFAALSFLLAFICYFFSRRL